MTKAEFLALPMVLQVRLLFEALSEETSRALLDREAPQIPKSPRYDLAIYRQGGNSWASEHSLDGLVWWRNRYKAGAEGGGQYAEQDRKRVTNLDKWVEWRELFPNECWSGTRGNEDVTAKPPTTKPTVYPRQGGNGQPRQQQRQQQQQQDDDIDNFKF